MSLFQSQTAVPEDAAVPSELPDPGAGLSRLELHEQGACRPCLHINFKAGCPRGERCNFCHLPHPKRNRPRPCKLTRIQCKQMAAMVDACQPGFEEVLLAAEPHGARNSYMRCVLRSKRRQGGPATLGDQGMEAPSNGQPGKLSL